MTQPDNTPFSGMEGTVTPGLVDLQVNGGFGCDFSIDPSSIWEVARLLPRYGVTAFLPTVITSGPDVALAALGVLTDGPPADWSGAAPLGLHLEGPMISRDRRGVHPEALLVPPSVDLAEKLIAAGPPAMVTLAPELPGAEEVIRLLVEAGTIVSVGHSDATAYQMEAAIEWGISHATHLFNAMSGIDHRAPGVAASVLTHDRITTGLIADGIHIADQVLRLTLQSMGPDRIALVTDAIAALGLGDGCFAVGSVPVTVRGITARTADGALAGSAAGMDHVLRTMRSATGCSWADAVAMASTTPARIVSHEPHPGDLVLFDNDLEVAATAVAGTVVYRRGSP